MHIPAVRLLVFVLICTLALPLPAMTGTADYSGNAHVLRRLNSPERKAFIEEARRIDAAAHAAFEQGEGKSVQLAHTPKSETDAPPEANIKDRSLVGTIAGVIQKQGQGSDSRYRRGAVSPESPQGRAGYSPSASSLQGGRARDVVTEWSVDPLDWGTFLCAVFDEWRERDLGRILVNWFETAVAQSMGLPAQICMTGELCGKGVAIEHTGQVFSCDHYVYPEYCLGNIHDRDLASLVFSGRQKAFAFGKRNSLPRYCLNCPHGTLCWGQCPRHRFVQTPDGEPGLNYLCPGLKVFYAHAKPAIRAIAAQCLNNAQQGA